MTNLEQLAEAFRRAEAELKKADERFEAAKVEIEEAGKACFAAGTELERAQKELLAFAGSGQGKRDALNERFKDRPRGDDFGELQPRTNENDCE